MGGHIRLAGEPESSSALAGDRIPERPTSGVIALRLPQPTDATAVLQRLRMRSCSQFGTWIEAQPDEDSAAALALEAARSAPEVLEIEWRPHHRPAGLPQAPDLTPWQWNLAAIAIGGAWQITRGSEGTVVAVLDDGLDTTHPGFSDRIVAGYDFVSDPSRSGDGDGSDGNPFDPVSTRSGRVGHGTAVSGVIAARSNGRTPVGIDAHCRLMPLRVVGVDDAAAPADLWNALIYAGDLGNSDLREFDWFETTFPGGLPEDRPRPQQAAHVVNISLATRYERSTSPIAIQVETDLLRALERRGIVIITAAGDEGRPIEDADSIVLPAASEHVITVAAMRRGSLALDEATNFGPAIDLTAPGGARTLEDALGDPELAPESGCVPSLDRSPRESTWVCGSSIAAAHVTGVVALMRSVAPTLQPARVAELLRETAIDPASLEPAPSTRAGALHAMRVVHAAAGLPAPAESLLIHGLAATVPANTSGTSILIGNPGGRLTDLEPHVASISYDGPSGWISSAAWLDLGDSSESPLTVIVDRSNLPDGTHRATVRLRTSIATEHDLTVICIQRSLPITAPFDRIQVELRDAVRGETIASQILDSRLREFRFLDVPPGRYTLLAGTDLDGDDAIDDDGEFFGVARETLHPRLVDVGSGTTLEDLEIVLARRARPIR